MDRLPLLNDACNLSSEDFEARLEILQDQLLPHVLNRAALTDGYVFEFDSSMREELEGLVAFEEQCCPDLHWNLRQEADRVHLEIRGLGGGLPVH